eukprot:12413393-Karenia_brevis.AAC.1
MYDILSNVLLTARRRGCFIILAGDWNAEVQASFGEGLTRAVGKYGNPTGNARGAWLKQWAEEEHL